MFLAVPAKDPVQQRGRSRPVRTPQCVRQPAAVEAEEENVPGPWWSEESPGGSPLRRRARPRPGRGVAARKNAGDQGGTMQRSKQKEGREGRGSAAPPPDPRHPEAVLDTVPRAAGIDVHKMSLTCTVLVESASGRVESETRQYRTYGAELHLLVDWLAGLNLARVVMESTGVCCAGASVRIRTW